MSESIFTIGAPGIDCDKIVAEIQASVVKKIEEGVYADARIARAERTNLANLQNEDEFLSFYLKCLRDVAFVDISDFEIRERRAAFAEDAIKPEIGCTNVKAAFALATAEDLFDRHGRPDWNALKATAPELFRKPTSGSADGGAGTRQAPQLDMNTLIRRAAGRG